MPEAAVYEHCRMVHREHDIRLSRQILAVQPEAISHPVEQGANNQLRLCVPISDAGHVPASVFR